MNRDLEALAVRVLCANRRTVCVDALNVSVVPGHDAIMIDRWKIANLTPHQKWRIRTNTTLYKFFRCFGHF